MTVKRLREAMMPENQTCPFCGNRLIKTVLPREGLACKNYKACPSQGQILPDWTWAEVRATKDANARLKDALESFKNFSYEAFRFVDADRHVKAMKLLRAMCGGLNGYRADVDKALGALELGPGLEVMADTKKAMEKVRLTESDFVQIQAVNERMRAALLDLAAAYENGLAPHWVSKVARKGLGREK